MALIKCPECTKEVSDKAKDCIRCGYPFGYGSKDIKPEMINKKKKKIIIPILILVFGVIIVSIIMYIINLSSPRRIYETAMLLIEEGEIGEALEILSEIKDYGDVEEIISNSEKELAYNRVLSLVELEEIEEAILILTELGDYKDSEEIKENIENEIYYKEALEFLSEGKYNDAKSNFNKIKDSDEYKDVPDLKEEMDNEDYLYQSINLIKKKLRNPDSFKLDDFKFFSETELVNNPSIIIIQYKAQNGFGGYVTSLAYLEKDIYRNIRFVEERFLPLYEKLLIGGNKDYKEIKEVKYNKERLETLIKNDAYSSIKIID